MGFCSDLELQQFGFKSLGKNVKISTKASIYNPEQIEIGDNSRIDDFCVISGRVVLGRNVHLASMCLVAGGKAGVYFEGCCGFAYGVRVFSQSDDYTGLFLGGPTFPAEYKKESNSPVFIRKLVIVGASSIILPGVDLAEGSAVGAMSLVTKSTEPWSVVFGIPAKKIKNRKKNVLQLMNDYLSKDLATSDDRG